MPRSKSRTPYVLLGLLERSPMTGYDVSKLLEQARYGFWNESYGQIYPHLKKLQKKGWAEMRVEEQEGGPDRKIYEITPAGQEALERWFREEPRDFTMRDEVVLQVDMGAGAALASTRAKLEGVVRDCEQRLGQLREEFAEDAYEVELFEAMSMEWMYRYLHARLQWARWALERLDEMSE